MIIIGYPGIGKSTLARDRMYSKYIDLESSNFWYDHGGGQQERDELWYIPYCNIAEDLSKQGFRVFVSSHTLVINQLMQSTEIVCAIYPKKSLRNEWVVKLEERYNNSQSKKDKNAWSRVEKYYDQDIDILSRLDIPHVEISSLDYNLHGAVEAMVIDNLQFIVTGAVFSI